MIWWKIKKLSPCRSIGAINSERTVFKGLRFVLLTVDTRDLSQVVVEGVDKYVSEVSWPWLTIKNSW